MQYNIPQIDVYSLVVYTGTDKHLTHDSITNWLYYYLIMYCLLL